MGGCYSSDLNKPPDVGEPAKRAKQSNIVVLTELSDLEDDDAVLKEPTKFTYRGRGSNRVGIMQPLQKERVEKELKEIQKESNKEVRRKQELQLQEKLRLQKHNYTLQKEKESKFREEYEKFRAESENKQKDQEVLQKEKKRRREIFKVDDNIKGLATVDEAEEVWTNPNKIIESRVYRPQQFNLTGITNSGWGLEVQKLGDDPEPKPPTYRKKDIVPNLNELNMFDKHVVKAPVSTKESVSTLVNYFKSAAENHFQLLRIFLQMNHF